MRILIVEDDKVLADALCSSMQHSGYAVDHVNQGEQADHMLAYQSYDLVILDLGLPKMDGFEVLKKLRQRNQKTPVLILTARDALTDRVKGLDIGADDYMLKPFELAELEARVRALIRRGQSGGAALLAIGMLSLDTVSRQASIQGVGLELSAREVAVLEILMLKAGRVVSKEQILEKLCNWDEDIGDNAIEVYIHRLRKKLSESDIQIRTIRGLGYLLEHIKTDAQFHS